MNAFVFAISVINDMKNMLESIEQVDVSRKAGNKSTAETERDQLQTLKQFIVFIDTHSHLKQLSAAC